MDILIGFIQQAVSYVLPFVILLGVLVFIHELGHFLVAIWCGVRVEVFSLGFGKKIFQFTRGDTTYAISLIPLGGYVKMYGESPELSIPEEQKKFSFSHKNVWQRIAIVLAGPLMNLFLAIFIFSLISAIGEKVPAPVVGQISSGSQADQAGLLPGDRIVSIQGFNIETWKDFNKKLLELGSVPIKIFVQSFNSNETREIQLTPKMIDNPDILEFRDKIPGIEGLELVAKGTAVGVKPNSIAENLGIKTGDRITKFAGQEVLRWYELKHYSEKLPMGSELQLAVSRYNPKNKKTTDYNFTVPLSKIKDSNISLLETIGLESAELYVSTILEDSPAMRAGLQIGDRIHNVGGLNLKSWDEFTKKIRSYEKGAPPLDVEILRSGETVNLSLTPKVIAHKDPMTELEVKTYKIGVASALLLGPPSSTIWKARGLGQILSTGISSSWEWTYKTIIGFVRLFQNRVSAKSIGGPIMIGQLASKTFQIGLTPFLKIMAIISINLFILNLLPIPVLDGGHLLFYSIEALRGTPLSMRKLEMAQQIGLVLLLSLMVFAIFNDITRVIGISW